MIGAPLAGILAAAGAGPKGIQYVGGTTGSTVGTASSWTISLTSLTGGIASAPAAGDFVVVFYGNGDSGQNTLSVISSGYTAQASVFGDDSNNTNLLVATKLLTGADTSITLSETFSAFNAGAAVVHVFRGVDPVTPLDVAVQTATQINEAAPDPPAITPATPGAVVVAGGSGAPAQTNPILSSDLAGFAWAFGDDTRRVVVGAGYIANASGAVDPAQFGGLPNTANAAAAVTLALRPAS